MKVHNKSSTLTSLIESQALIIGVNNLLFISDEGLKNKIENELIENSNEILLLVSNENKLKKSTESITIMTYIKFGELMRYTDKFATKFSIIICDEIDSLITQQFENDSANLLVAMRYLLREHDYQVKFHFSKNLAPINMLQGISDRAMRDVKIFDFM